MTPSTIDSPRLPRPLVSTLAFAFTLLATAYVLPRPAAADPYWIAYEGDDFPENEGWTRDINAAGGADRRIEDGALVIDSLNNAAIWDEYVIQDLQDPGPGEIFAAEWRMLVEETLFWYDSGVTIARSHQPGDAFFVYDVDHMLVWREWETVPFVPGVWHTYRIESADMVDYTLLIDGQDVFSGRFEDESLLQSYFAWGDRANGAASLTRWDYVRFGVVPEPITLSYCVLAALAHRAARHR